MHSLVTNCSVVEACVQVRAESPMEHSAQGKRSGTLGLRVLEQSRPVRAKALQCALVFYWTAIIGYISSDFGAFKGCSPGRAVALRACGQAHYSEYRTSRP